MDLFVLLFLSAISILFGAILTLILQYYVLLVYFKKNPVAERPNKPRTDVYSLPDVSSFSVDFLKYFKSVFFRESKEKLRATTMLVTKREIPAFQLV